MHCGDGEFNCTKLVPEVWGGKIQLREKYVGGRRGRFRHGSGHTNIPLCTLPFVKILYNFFRGFDDSVSSAEAGGSNLFVPIIYALRLLRHPRQTDRRTSNWLTIITIITIISVKAGRPAASLYYKFCNQFDGISALWFRKASSLVHFRLPYFSKSTTVPTSLISEKIIIYATCNQTLCSQNRDDIITIFRPAGNNRQLL